MTDGDRLIVLARLPFLLMRDPELLFDFGPLFIFPDSAFDIILLGSTKSRMLCVKGGK